MVYSGTLVQPYISLLNPVTNSAYYYSDTVTFNWVDTNIPSDGAHGLQLSCANYAYPTTDHWFEWGTSGYTQHIMNTGSAITASNTSGFSFNNDIYCHWRVVFYSSPGNSNSLSATSPARNIIFRIATM
jgi:hypothetical protein